MKKILLFVYVFIFSSSFCFAQEEVLQTSLKPTSSEPNMLWVVFSLFFVVFLIYITGIIYTKLNVAGAKAVKEQIKTFEANNIIVLSTKQIGQNRNLHVIQVEDKRLVIGSTPEAITLIKELKETAKQENTVSFDINSENTSEKICEEVVEEFDVHKKYL